MNSITTDIGQLAQARANVYRFLHSLYAGPPSAELIAGMKEARFARYLEEVFGQSAALLIGYLAELRDDGVPDELRLEYDALFRVPGHQYTKPYEAVYRDRRVVGDRVVDGLVWGPSTVAVKEFYIRAGAILSSESPELPDFIGLELEFMGLLCQQEAAAWQRGDEETARRFLSAQQRFLDEHLTRWLDGFCDTMHEQARLDFYKGLAEITRGYVHQDGEAVQRLMAELAG
ncbi:MAG: molecular chaperone [Anaerolineae bacterium]